MERWKPEVACSPREERLLKLAGKSRKLLVFLRLHRHELFDAAFQAELEAGDRRGMLRVDQVAVVRHRVLASCTARRLSSWMASYRRRDAEQVKKQRDAMRPKAGDS